MERVVITIQGAKHLDLDGVSVRLDVAGSARPVQLTELDGTTSNVATSLVWGLIWDALGDLAYALRKLRLMQRANRGGDVQPVPVPPPLMLGADPFPEGDTKR